MKQKYILGIYNKLINEIKYHKKTADSEIISYLKNCSNESYYLHKIKFSKQQGKIKYAYQKRIHNLHPNAYDFINSECTINPELENLIPLILKELNIPDANLKFCWSDQNEKTILIIKEPCSLEDIPSENLFFLYCYNLVKNENHNIKESLNETFFSLKKEDKIVLYIHRKQFALENLSKSLIEEINPTNPVDIYSYSSDYQKEDCLKIIYLYLEKLLIFIEKEYQTYLNINNKVPFRSILVKELEIENKLTFVKTHLSNNNLNDDLFKLAYQPLLKIATIKIQEKITYNEFYYCIDYINELYNHFQINNGAVSESVLTDWLFELNFNSLDFFDYKTNIITKHLENMETEIDKIDSLFHLLKILNQTHNKNFRKFNQKLPSSKEQIVSWIEEEIEYLSKKKDLSANNRNDANNTGARVKIQTSLSVAQLSYFFKLLMKVKIIIHKNNAEVFRFVAENFISKSSTQISAGSVKSKFHNVEIGTIRTIRAYIIELMNLTK